VGRQRKGGIYNSDAYEGVPDYEYEENRGDKPAKTCGSDMKEARSFMVYNWEKDKG